MNLLFALIVSLLAFSCSSADAHSDDSWVEFGAVQQPMLRRTFDVTPAADTYDFNNATQLNGNGWVGPFLVGLSGWVTSSDPAAGNLIFDITYTDPTSTTRTVNFGGASPVLDLTDSASFFATQAVYMMRLSDTSAWDLNVSLFGSAGTSTVHYEILIGASTAWNEVFPFSDQP